MNTGTKVKQNRQNKQMKNTNWDKYINYSRVLICEKKQVIIKH